MSNYDLIVIGAGPGGYVCALRAAQLGSSVAVVEKRAAGGTCLNLGCVPTKALLHGAAAGGSYEDVYAEKDKVVAGQSEGVAALFKAAGVTMYKDTAVITAAGKVLLSDSGDTIEAKNIVIASGATPSVPPIPGADLAGVVTSDDLLGPATALPKRVAIIGGGVIGVEMASLYHALGSDVTVLEALPRLLANMDKEIGQSLAMQFKKDGITVATGAAVNRIEEGDGGLVVTYTLKEKENTVACDQVLIATGRRAVSDVFAEDVEVTRERGFIVVDDQYRTSVDGVYAIGDVRGGIQLAHNASAQGKALAEQLHGHTPEQRLDLIPSCVYTQPEIGCVGMDQQQAKDAGIDTIVGKFSMGGNAKTVIDGLGRSFIKLVFRADDHKLIGAQLFCGRASDLVATLGVAMVAGMTAETLASTVFAHPTYAEGIGEAAEAALGCCVHVIKR